MVMTKLPAWKKRIVELSLYFFVAELLIIYTTIIIIIMVIIPLDAIGFLWEKIAIVFFDAVIYFF